MPKIGVSWALPFRGVLEFNYESVFLRSLKQA